MSEQEGFGVWITGIPASGKSSVSRELARQLRALNVPVVVLESDTMRNILTPEASYTEAERDRFYRQLVLIGELIIRSGVNVLFDATAHKRAYRDFGRRLVKRFVEVYIDCPLEICAKRDPKGIYARAAMNKSATVPGLQVPYEPPSNPELTLDGKTLPVENAATILDSLKKLLHI